jgi:hydroxyacylglutathione hydrolase
MTTQFHRLPLGFVNSFLIQAKKNILIDSGVQKDGKKLFNLLSKISIEPKDIGMVFLTHSHQDHTGALHLLKTISNCSVAVNRHESEYVEKGVSPRLVATNRTGIFFTWFTRLGPAKSSTAGTVVDWVLEDKEYSLEPFGIKGKILYTPGHTSGSMSILLDSGDAFIGDLIQNLSIFSNHPNMPFLVEDALIIKKSIQYLISEGACTFHPAHGKQFQARALGNLLD